ncbi:MAG: 50S ribosomal protein L21 [Candidatus Cloacimonadota bacterium]|nr:50S ribosomal protein L21 [Candidatus Cloacimonadota bacterium]
MYAIIDFKGKQLKIEQNKILKVPFLDGRETGTEFEIDNVLLLQAEDKTTIGTPTVENVKIVAEVLEHGRDRKIIVFKKNRRKSYSRKQGHRQNYTKIKVKDIKIS